MKVELHCHTNRYSICATNTPEEMLEAFVVAGYDVVFITEHDKVWSNQELYEIQLQFPKIKIFPGMELRFPGSLTELLVLGSNDSGYLNLPDEASVLAKARIERHLTILAHSFRYEGGDEMLHRGLVPDALEARTCNHEAMQAEKARREAAVLGVNHVNSGDSHGVTFINRFWIETFTEFNIATDIRDIILAGNYRNRSDDSK